MHACQDAASSDDIYTESLVVSSQSTLMDLKDRLRLTLTSLTPSPITLSDQLYPYPYHPNSSTYLYLLP